MSDDIIGATTHAPASVVTRRQVLIAGLIIGLALAVTLGGVVWIALRVNKVQQDEIANNQSAIARLSRIEHPTSADLQKGVARAIHQCAAHPRCRALFKEITNPAAALRIERRRLSRAGRVIPIADTAGPGIAMRRTASASPAPRRPAKPNQGAGGPSSPSQGPAPSPSGGSTPPPSPPASPPINIKAPGITVCTPVLGVNC